MHAIVVIDGMAHRETSESGRESVFLFCVDFSLLILRRPAKNWPSMCSDDMAFFVVLENTTQRHLKHLCNSNGTTLKYNMFATRVHLQFKVFTTRLLRISCKV